MLYFDNLKRENMIQNYSALNYDYLMGKLPNRIIFQTKDVRV